MKCWNFVVSRIKRRIYRVRQKLKIRPVQPCTGKWDHKTYKKGSRGRLFGFFHIFLTHPNIRGPGQIPRKKKPTRIYFIIEPPLNKQSFSRSPEVANPPKKFFSCLEKSMLNGSFRERQRHPKSPLSNHIWAGVPQKSFFPMHTFWEKSQK